MTFSGVYVNVYLQDQRVDDDGWMNEDGIQSGDSKAPGAKAGDCFISLSCFPWFHFFHFSSFLGINTSDVHAVSYFQ